MKINLLMISVTALAATLFAACHNHEHEAEDHDHANESREADKHGDEHSHAQDEIAFTAQQAQSAHLKVSELQPTQFTEVVEVSGRVLPASGTEATVSATMAGIVKFANASLTDGVAVSAGQTLFVVNAQAIANGNPAAVAQSELAAARSAYERAKKLAAEHIISQRELEEAHQRYQAATTTAKSLGSASQHRGISAPISGYVKNLQVKPGDYVSAGQALATITQNRRLQLRADVPERYYSLLSRISVANFRMAYDDGHTYSLNELGGRLVSKGHATATGEYFVPIIFEFNNQGNIVAGSFAEVYLQGGVRRGVLCVPNEAITEAQGLYFVYIQTNADAYRRQEVQLGATDGRRTEIVSGLKAGDKVVTHGATQVRLAANASVAPEGHSH